MVVYGGEITQEAKLDDLIDPFKSKNIGSLWKNTSKKWWIQSPVEDRDTERNDFTKQKVHLG